MFTARRLGHDRRTKVFEKNIGSLKKQIIKNFLPQRQRDPYTRRVTNAKKRELFVFGRILTFEVTSRTSFTDTRDCFSFIMEETIRLQSGVRFDFR